MNQKKKNSFYNNKFEIRNKIIKTRFFLAPINLGIANYGKPTEDLIQFHSLRSGNKIGISYVGNVAIDSKFKTNENTLYFNDERSKWKELIYKIRKNGSLPGVQLGCRCSKVSPIRSWKSDDKKKYIDRVRDEINSYSKEFINNIINSYVESACIAYDLGFEVIQIHAAHGYFLSLFLSNNFNHRNDDYGRSKILILKKIIKKIRNELPDVILDVRISLLEGVKSLKKEMEFKKDLINDIVDLNIDIISVSNGIYNIDKKYIYPPKEWGHAVYLSKIIPFAKKYKKIIWNIAGNIWNINKINFNIPENVAFSIGRSLIADYQFIEKFYKNKEDKINKCIRCGSCHYYSNNDDFLICKINNEKN